MTVAPLRERPAWKKLQHHYDEVRGRHLRELFAEDPARSKRLSAEAVGIYLDYSKNRITDETVRLLIQLAEESDLAGRRDAMFTGEHINVSRTAPSCTSRSACHARPTLVVDGSTSSRRFTPSSTRWRLSPSGSGRANGRATPASPYATSSTSESAVRTSAR